MKDDNRKAIKLLPELYDQFVAFKADGETTANLVRRCINILSSLGDDAAQDVSTVNEYDITLHIVERRGV